MTGQVIKIHCYLFDIKGETADDSALLLTRECGTWTAFTATGPIDLSATTATELSQLTETVIAARARQWADQSAAQDDPAT